MSLVQIRLYDLFWKELNLSDEMAAAFVFAIEEVVGQEFKSERQAHATKDDIHKLELKIEESKGDIYKAMFWTSIVQLMAILGGVLAIIKFMG